MALKFSIRSGALAPNAVVSGFRGLEGLGRPYAFDVYVNVPGDLELDLADVIGSRATLLIEDGMLVQASFGGVFNSFELVRAIRGNALYRARIVPRLWQLTQTRHSRIWTKKSVKDVIESVLDDEGITDFELRLVRDYPVEEHICQYKESSLDFIHRWMEREGIYYFFEQADDGEKVIFVDDKSQHAAVVTGPVRYHPTVGKDRSAGRHFDNFIARHTSLPASVRLDDYDYVKPSLEVTGRATVLASGVGEIRDYGGRFFGSGDGSRLATLRAEELRAQGTTYHATGAAAGLSPGFFVLLHVVVSMGNNASSKVSYPSNIQGVIAVGSTDPDDTRSEVFNWSATSGSNFGPHISVVAPGSFIYGLSHKDNSDYNTYFSGTSQATAYVSGLASLLRAQLPDASNMEIKDLIESTADDQVGTASEDKVGKDDYYGNGRINAYSALLVNAPQPFELNEGDVSVYPNPSSGSFFMNYPVEVEKVIITNALGLKLKELDAKEHNGTQISVDVNGYVLVSFSYQDQIVTKKIIVVQ